MKLIGRPILAPYKKYLSNAKMVKHVSRKSETLVTDVPFIGGGLHICGQLLWGKKCCLEMSGENLIGFFLCFPCFSIEQASCQDQSHLEARNKLSEQFYSCSLCEACRPLLLSKTYHLNSLRIILYYSKISKKYTDMKKNNIQCVLPFQKTETNPIVKLAKSQRETHDVVI